MKYRSLSFNWLENIIVPTIDLFYNTPIDKELITRDASERTIVANIYCKMNLFFQKNQKSNTVLEHIRIDVEYNRNLIDPKKAYMKCDLCQQNRCFVRTHNFGEANIVPDIIIHRRGSNDDNQVAIEFKKNGNKDKNRRNNDIAKLTYLTCQQPFEQNEKYNYKYRYGYFIDMDKDSYSVTSYENAKEKTKKTRKDGNWI